jgi:hypothetical protein
MDTAYAPSLLIIMVQVLVVARVWNSLHWRLRLLTSIMRLCMALSRHPCPCMACACSLHRAACHCLVRLHFRSPRLLLWSVRPRIMCQTRLHLTRRCRHHLM